MKETQRIKEILARVNPADTRDAASGSENRDDPEKVIAGLQELDKALQSKSARIHSLIELTLDYTIMDFSKKAMISENKDEIDALSAGLNALGEEMKHSLDTQNRFRKELEDKANQLDATNKELESFAYSVSHDLRTPLRAIHGYSQVLVEDCNEKLDSGCERALAAIMHNAKKMGQLIDDLLTFSRLGRKELSKTELDTTELVKAASQFFKPQYPETEIIVQPMSPAYADYSLLNLVYQNLISNAIKYSSKKESPVIEIGETVTERGRVFYVKDNGAGFNMEYYDKLFGVFQRLHRDDEFEGTGVGLPIVQRIIHRHGGSVWAEGVVGEGAVFYFTLTSQEGQ
ncbi:MAG: ATP-binding protein [Balneolales bacterium]